MRLICRLLKGDIFSRTLTWRRGKKKTKNKNSFCTESRLQRGAWFPLTCFSWLEDHRNQSDVELQALNPWSWIRAEREGDWRQKGPTARRGLLSLQCARAEQSPKDVTSCYAIHMKVYWSDLLPACFSSLSPGVSDRSTSSSKDLGSLCVWSSLNSHLSVRSRTWAPWRH